MGDVQLASSDLSAGAAAFSHCPSCRHRWTPTAWFIVDARNRPDLIGAIAEGSLHAFRCESCGITVNANVPLLVVRDEAPRLLFSPSPGTTAIDDHNQLVSGLKSLKAALASRWSDELLRDMSILARRLLPVVMPNSESMCE